MIQRFIVVSVRDTASTGTHNRYGTTQPREHYSTAPCWPLMPPLNTNAAKVTLF